MGSICYYHVRMDLHKYLNSPGALTVAELRSRMARLGYPIKDDAQIRQWQHAYSGRRPSPENCTGIEAATEGLVTRRDLRPDDWHLIWPELKEPSHA